MHLATKARPQITSNPTSGFNNFIKPPDIKRNYAKVSKSKFQSKVACYLPVEFYYWFK